MAKTNMKNTETKTTSEAKQPKENRYTRYFAELKRLSVERKAKKAEMEAKQKAALDEYRAYVKDVYKAGAKAALAKFESEKLPRKPKAEKTAKKPAKKAVAKDTLKAAAAKNPKAK